MTVGELKKLLADIDDALPVWIRAEDFSRDVCVVCVATTAKIDSEYWGLSIQRPKNMLLIDGWKDRGCAG